MTACRVLLIGGTSHCGKSTVARALAAGRGWEHLSTDRLARHPGRPWPTVPDHVAAHYRALSPDELAAAQLRHYEAMWPVIAATIAEADLLVLEGSGIWPDRVADLGSDSVAALWLTAEADTLRRRIHASSRYADRTSDEQLLVDKFVARTLLYDELMRDAVRRRGLPCIDVSARSVDEVVRAAESIAGPGP